MLSENNNKRAIIINIPVLLYKVSISTKNIWFFFRNYIKILCISKTDHKKKMCYVVLFRNSHTFAYLNRFASWNNFFVCENLIKLNCRLYSSPTYTHTYFKQKYSIQQNSTILYFWLNYEHDFKAIYICTLIYIFYLFAKIVYY